MRIATSLVTTLILFVCAYAGLVAQVPFRAPIILKNATPDDAGVKNRDTLLIGIDPNATDGLDTSLGEKRLPPFPPDQIFEARLVDRPGKPVFGNGSRTDLRSVTGSNQIDTFLIRLQTGSGGVPVTISWPERLSAYARRMTISTSAGSADMLAEKELVILDPDVTRATIIREGAGVSGLDVARSTGFFQLEPVRNPIRRGQSLTVGYALSRPSKMEVTLIDLLGRATARSDEGIVGAGLRSATLNLSDCSSGSYMLIVAVDRVTVIRQRLVVE